MRRGEAREWREREGGNRGEEEEREGGRSVKEGRRQRGRGREIMKGRREVTGEEEGKRGKGGGSLL